jgi:hypothetical protein
MYVFLRSAPVEFASTTTGYAIDAGEPSSDRPAWPPPLSRSTVLDYGSDET